MMTFCLVELDIEALVKDGCLYLCFLKFSLLNGPKISVSFAMRPFPHVHIGLSKNKKSVSVGYLICI